MSNSIFCDNVEYLRINAALSEFFTSRSSLDHYMKDGRVCYYELPDGRRMPRRSNLE